MTNEYLTPDEMKRLTLLHMSPAPWDPPQLHKAWKALHKSEERLRKAQCEALLALEKAQKGVLVAQAQYFSVLHSKAA